MSENIDTREEKRRITLQRKKQEEFAEYLRLEEETKG
jgi:hypothetical protein